MTNISPARKVVKTGAGGTISPAFLPDDRLDWHLANWATSHHGSRYLPALIEIAPGLTNGGASRDVDEMTDEGAIEKAAVVECIVGDIRGKNPAAYAALLNRYGIASVFRFPRGNEAACLTRAREYVRAGLEAKGTYY